MKILSRLLPRPATAGLSNSSPYRGEGDRRQAVEGSPRRAKIKLTTVDGPAVIPHQRDDGTWTLHICGLGRDIGNYPNSADAYRAARRSGYKIGEDLH